MKFMLSVSYYLGVMLFLTSLSMLFYSIMFYFTSYIMFVEWEIIEFNSSSIIMTLLVDWMSLSFMSLVMMISSMVLLYSYVYMAGDKFFYRFIMLVYLFVASMVFLILSPNMISILLGWDGLGLVSYCLVIYYQNVKSANAGMVTILSNRIGDIAILLSISWLLNYGSWNFFYLQYMYSSSELFMLMVLVVLAAMTKSAQMPFSAWLPAAMAAPTPVSSLVHSSTLVTAGVYLLIRFHVLLMENNFLFWIGVLTMFMSGLGANFETDLKKIIALSTLSQLGLMMMTLGLGFVEFSFFHLMTHAMFKSLLFLCAGVFIHSMGDTQDIRMMGGLFISCPVTSFYFMGSSMALCGFPFLAGFYSKDVILEMLFMSKMNLFMFNIVVLSTIFTLTYTVRLMYYIFYNNLGLKSLLNLEESVFMLFPMSVLMFLSIFAGGIMSVFMFPVVMVYLPILFKMMILLGLMFMFMVTLYMLNLKVMKNLSYTVFSSSFFGSMWYLPYLTSVLWMPILKSGESLIKSVDQGWVEYLSGQGFNYKTSRVSLWLDMFNLMNMKFYIYMFFMFGLFSMCILL